jgi:GxxExxY protein
MEWEKRETVKFGHGTDRIIGALIEVHRTLGPGLLESAYEACVCAELKARDIAFARQVPLPITYKNETIDCGYRLDIVVQGDVLIELKTVERLLPIHEAQVVTYLRLARIPVGLLVNFNVRTLKEGLRRLAPNHPNPSRSPGLPVQILEPARPHSGACGQHSDFEDTP